jgi:hypothetical protein
MKNKEIREEIELAVDKINDELIDKDILDVGFSFTFSGPYAFIGISLLNGEEFNIYNSEDNDRKYYEKSDSYEPFYDLIKRRFLEIKRELNKIKL